MTFLNAIRRVTQLTWLPSQILLPMQPIHFTKFQPSSIQKTIIKLLHQPKLMVFRNIQQFQATCQSQGLSVYLNLVKMTKKNSRMKLKKKKVETMLKKSKTKILKRMRSRKKTKTKYLMELVIAERHHLMRTT